MTIALAVVLVLILGVVAAATAADATARARRIAALEPLRQPRLTRLPDRRVLQVEATGDPAAVAGKAIGLLLQAYFRIPGVPRGGPGLPAPRARWPVDPATPRESWHGVYALPVPDTIAAFAPLESGGLHVELATWSYGEIAEILHVGPYADECPTIERLRRFVAEQGQEPVGEHEEEYVLGPGRFGRGDPKGYVTVLRWRVRPRA